MPWARLSRPVGPDGVGARALLLIPLTWKRRNFAVFEPCRMIDRLYAVAVSGGLVSGPFAIYKHPQANGFVLIHLPSQAKILDLDMQNACKDATEKFAALPARPEGGCAKR